MSRLSDDAMWRRRESGFIPREVDVTPVVDITLTIGDHNTPNTPDTHVSTDMLKWMIENGFA